MRIVGSDLQKTWNCLRPWYAKIAASIVAIVPRMLTTSDRTDRRSLSDIGGADMQLLSARGAIIQEESLPMIVRFSTRNETLPVFR